MNAHLLLERCHALLQVELQALIRLGQQLVHSVGETLVVFIVHPLPLSRLDQRYKERGRERESEWEEKSVLAHDKKKNACLAERAGQSKCKTNPTHTQ